MAAARPDCQSTAGRQARRCLNIAAQCLRLPFPCLLIRAASPPNVGLWRRFGAFVHELLFLVAYLFIVGLIFASLSGESMSAGRPGIDRAGRRLSAGLPVSCPSAPTSSISGLTGGAPCALLRPGHCGCFAADGGTLTLGRPSSAISPPGSPALGLGMFMLIGTFKAVPGWILGLFVQFPVGFADRGGSFCRPAGGDASGLFGTVAFRPNPLSEGLKAHFFQYRFCNFCLKPNADGLFWKADGSVRRVSHAQTCSRIRCQ